MLTRSIKWECFVKLKHEVELTPQVAAFYAKKTTKTLSRDISLLMKKELIGMSPTGVRAKKEVVLAFRPFVAPPKPQSA